MKSSVLFSIFLLCNSTGLLAQTEKFSKENLYNVKWYLNAIQITGFGGNDSASIITQVEGKHFIRFGESIEFGKDSSDYSPAESTFFPYIERVDPNYYSPDIYVFASKKDRKKHKIKTYYSVYGSDYPYEIHMGNYMPATLFENSTEVQQLLILSREYDSLGITAGILGDWIQEPDTSGDSDTLVLKKTRTNNSSDKPTFNFSRDYGDRWCFTESLDNYLPETVKRGRAPDPYYVSHSGTGTPYLIDLHNQQLFFPYKGLVFDILSFTPTELQLKLVTP